MLRQRESIANSTMTLNLYRKHSKKCSQNRPEKSHNRKAEEAKRLGWKKCDCPIYATGTLSDGFNRKNTKKTEWEEAEALAEAWVRVGVWSGSPVVAAPTEFQTSNSRTTVEHGVSTFLAKCAGRQIQPTTLRKIKTYAKQFTEFCAEKGYVNIDQLQFGDGDLFYGTWKDGPKAAGKKLGRFRKMVKLWMKSGWLTHDLGVSDIELPMGANEGADREPFTDDELEAIYKACDEIGTVVWENHTGKHSWCGEDLKDFIMLKVHTGLRISDAATFDAGKRLDAKPNSVFLRAKKNGYRLYTWIPDPVLNRLQDRRKKYGNKIFQTGKSERLDTITDMWRRKLNRVFELAQKNAKFSAKATPHRFRYTFVRILLEHGVPVPDVAELSGDTEAIIRKHYIKWVPALQERLDKILQEAFARKPNLAIVPKKSA
jgi:integrase